MADYIKLVLVNDSEEFLEVLKSLIEQETDDFDIKVSDNPESIIEGVQRGSYDCIISDYNMPEMDGLTLLEKVRDIDEQIPFVLASADEKYLREAIEKGADDFFLKTSDPDQISVLVKRVKNVIEASKASRKLDNKDYTITDVIAHDLRNPLNTALGHLNLGVETGNTEDFMTVEKALLRMNAIIDDLVLITRGHIGIQTTNFSISEAFEDALEFAQKEDLLYEIESDKNIEGSRESVIRLFENLIDNSVKHNHGIEIKIKLGVLENGFYYEDDGEGVENLSEFTKLFSRGYSTLDDSMGLGLSIVGRIADIHGWDIKALNTDEGGLRMEFTDK